MSYSLLILLLHGIAGASTASPTPVEMAKALSGFARRTIPTRDVRLVICQHIEAEPTEAECKWQQKKDGRWQRYSTYLAVDAQGWHLIDNPTPID